MPETSPPDFRESLAQRLRESGLNIAVTGGSSWLGQASLLLLEQAFGNALSTRVSVFGSSARVHRLPSGRIIEIRPLADMAALPARPHLFLHYAFVTKGHIASHSLTDYVKLNNDIAESVEAAVRRIPVSGFFLPSSGAVYRPDRSLHTNLEENPYGVLKLGDEARFGSLCNTMGSKLTTIRIFNLAGPCINNISGYALSSIIRDVLRGDPVEIRASRPVYRSYVHIIDLIELALEALLSPTWGSSEPFDTAGEVTLEVGDLARLITENMGLPGYPIRRAMMTGEAPDRYIGNRTKWLKHAADLDIDLKGMQTQIKDTVTYLKN